MLHHGPFVPLCTIYWGGYEGAAMDPEQVELDEVVCEVHHVEIAIQIIRQAVGGPAKIARNAGKSEIEQLKDRVKAAVSELAGPDGHANARIVKKKVLGGVHPSLRNGLVTSMIEDGELFEVSNETGGRPSLLWALAETPWRDRRCPLSAVFPSPSISLCRRSDTSAVRRSKPSEWC
jgi:hypothetical protein